MTRVRSNLFFKQTSTFITFNNNLPSERIFETNPFVLTFIRLCFKTVLISPFKYPFFIFGKSRLRI